VRPFKTLVPLAALACLAGLAPGPARAQAFDAGRDRWLAPDKALHFGGGYGAAAAGYALATGLDADVGRRNAAAVVSGAAAGLLKEAFDAGVQRERASWKDLAVDALGIAAFLSLAEAAR